MIKNVDVVRQIQGFTVYCKVCNNICINKRRVIHSHHDIFRKNYNPFIGPFLHLKWPNFNW